MLFCLSLPLFVVSTLCSHSLASVLKRDLPPEILDLELIFCSNRINNLEAILISFRGGRSLFSTLAKQEVCIIYEKLNLCMLCDIVEVTLPWEGSLVT